MKPAERRRRTPWRDNIEAVTMAIVMALLLKYFAVEAYRIPSGSMQPTLIGDEEAGIFDRILVDKLAYRLREPRRWEVVVFRYPLDRSKNFVKRLVGVGPEDVRIEAGDLWRRADASQPWEHLRRPRSVTDATWKALDVHAPAEPSWESASYAAEWSFAGRSVHARGDGRARFQPGRTPIRDLYFDGYEEPLTSLLHRTSAASGRNFVGDLRVTGEVVALAGTRALVVELEEGPLRYRLRIPGPAADDGERPMLSVIAPADTTEALHAQVQAEEAFRLPAGQAVRFDAQNLDDRLELSLGGEVVARLDVEVELDQRSGVVLEVEGEGADLSDLMVYRDIYYTSRNEPWYTVPEGHYFMLGDNTQDSSDGREWTFLRYEVDRADAGGRTEVVRGSKRNGENPLFVPGLAEGPMTRFRDEWGETHWFPMDASRQLSPVRAPYVPRDMILGHAVAVFWPLNPFKGLHRLGWVN